jgi:hypothetical protein
MAVRNHRLIQLAANMALFVSSATSKDELTNQMEAEVTKVLHHLAPLRRCNHRAPKVVNQSINDF